MKKGRVNQKLRTRKAILDAAATLIGQGKTPSLAEIADEALVSKATAYRYFPSLDGLLLEVSLDTKVASPAEILRDSDPQDVAQRVARVHDFLYGLIADNEAQFRLFLRASMEQWIQTEGASDTPLRGARRIPMLEAALAPHIDQIGEKTREKLLYALCALVSVEPFIVLTDVCRLAPDRGKEITRWAVKTLVRATVEDVGTNNQNR